MEIELSLQSRALFVDRFPRWNRETAETETSFGDHGRPLYLIKTQGFVSASVFKPEFTRSRSLTLPNYLHDDVVGMMIEVMMWLPSW